MRDFSFVIEKHITGQGITGWKIAAAALALVDKPYHHQGRDPEQGLDCAGVLTATFSLLGVQLLERKPDYPPLPPEAYLRECLARNFQPVDRTQPEVGDILHLKFNRDRQARHLAIVVPGPFELQVVHALKRQRKVCLELLRGVLTNARIVGIHQWN